MEKQNPPLKVPYPVVLASGSPRRKELFTKLRIPFTIQTTPIKEHIPSTISPKNAALHLAKLKIQPFKANINNTLYITADTIVLAGTKVLGKPKSEYQAVEMLKSLSNTTHQVITGVCFCLNGSINCFDVSTQVGFGSLSETEILNYVATQQANDKAGAYGIQDWIGLIGIKSIAGSYYNVMGLPTYELYQYLKTKYCS